MAARQLAQLEMAFGLEGVAACEASPLRHQNGLYEEVTSAQHRKKFGQVFTPSRVAALMADWLKDIKPARILDPGIGLGALTKACLDAFPDTQIEAIELDSVVRSCIDPTIAAKCCIRIGDFLSQNTAGAYDAVIMNPPYVRHRQLENHTEIRAAVGLEAGCSIPKSANIYVDFVLKALVSLRPDGRASILIPSEWMSANFAVCLKQKLIDSGRLHGIVTFSHTSRIFEGALTTACILLLGERRTDTDILSYYLEDVEAESAPSTFEAMRSAVQPRRVSPSLLRHAPKWEPILRGDAAGMPTGWVPLANLASPRRGIATGSNDFFLINHSTVSRESIRRINLTECVGRARDVAGLIFTHSDFQSLNGQDARVWLLNFKAAPDIAEQHYIRIGEKSGVAARYLTRTRNPWFSMEQREPSPIWASVFARGDLKFIYNAAGVRSLTNFHCLYPLEDSQEFARALVAVLNSRPLRDLTLSHRRGFGGGLAKFEPNDLLRIPVPNLAQADKAIISELSSLLDCADKAARENSNSSLKEIDRIVAELT